MYSKKTVNNMSPEPLTPKDPRVKYESTQVRGHTWSYILGEPEGQPKDTVVLVHGFPDISYGWRYQIPYLMSLGYRVVAPDMLGYGGTDAPASPEEYTLKKLSGDINELARKFVGDGQIILGGHDWGGALVWRVALWYPELIKAVFSVCTPYHAPRKEQVSLETIIASGKMRNFGYQIQFKGPDVEERIQGAEKIRQFINSLFGGFTPDGEMGFRVSKGIIFENLPKLQQAFLISAEDLDYYVQQYMRHEAPQMRGPLNWYRTRDLNYQEELPLADKGVKVRMPSLFVSASGDSALPPALSASMDAHFEQLTRGEVDATHWALTQASDDVNEKIGQWLKGLQNTSVKASL